MQNWQGQAVETDQTCELCWPLHANLEAHRCLCHSSTPVGWLTYEVRQVERYALLLRVVQQVRDFWPGYLRTDLLSMS
jgi:hypothetical protein